MWTILSDLRPILGDSARILYELPLKMTYEPLSWVNSAGKRRWRLVRAR
jgi:hypothetical protein